MRRMQSYTVRADLSVVEQVSLGDALSGFQVATDSTHPLRLLLFCYSCVVLIASCCWLLLTDHCNCDAAAAAGGCARS